MDYVCFLLTTNIIIRETVRILHKDTFVCKEKSRKRHHLSLFLNTYTAKLIRTDGDFIVWSMVVFTFLALVTTLYSTFIPHCVYNMS